MQATETSTPTPTPTPATLPTQRIGAPTCLLTQVHALHADAAAHWASALRASPYAVQYLNARGIGGAIAARFGLGCARPAWRDLGGVLERHGEDAVAASGLVAHRSGDAKAKYSSGFDRFRDRIMFPIRTRDGQIAGFGGRLIEPGGAASTQGGGATWSAPKGGRGARRRRGDSGASSPRARRAKACLTTARPCWDSGGRSCWRCGWLEGWGTRERRRARCARGLWPARRSWRRGSASRLAAHCRGRRLGSPAASSEGSPAACGRRSIVRVRWGDCCSFQGYRDVLGFKGLSRHERGDRAAPLIPRSP